MIRRISALAATLTLPAAVLAVQAPSAHAASGGCPAGYVSVGAGPASIGGIGTLDIKFNHTSKIWCFETSASSTSETHVNGKYAASAGWIVGADGFGTIHVGLTSNGGKCAIARGVVIQRTRSESATIQRCRV